MQELMERAGVRTQGGGQPQASPALGDLITQYSSILASQVLHAVHVDRVHAFLPWYTPCCSPVLHYPHPTQGISDWVMNMLVYMSASRCCYCCLCMSGIMSHVELNLHYQDPKILQVSVVVVLLSTIRG